MDFFQRLQRANEARQAEWDTGGNITLSYRGNELAGETGEVCNKIKKLERQSFGMVGSTTTLDEIAEELADVIICTSLIAMKLGIDLERSTIDKFNKTSAKNGLTTRMEE